VVDTDRHVNRPDRCGSQQRFHPIGAFGIESHPDELAGSTAAYSAGTRLQSHRLPSLTRGLIAMPHQVVREIKRMMSGKADSILRPSGRPS